MKRQRFHFYIGHVLPTVSCGSSREHSRESNLDAVVSTRSCHEVLACRTAGVSGKLRGIPRGSEGSRGPIRSEPDESLPATPHPARIMIDPLDGGCSNGGAYSTTGTCRLGNSWRAAATDDE